MKYFERKVVKKTSVNCFKKHWHIVQKQYVKTNNIEKFNKKLRIKFLESDSAKRFLLHKDSDRIYSEDEMPSSLDALSEK